MSSSKADYDLQPTRRFSERVDYYVRYRPGYPGELIDLLRREIGLTSEHVVADVGSGTGKLTEMLLQNGNVVYGVEPNREMRGAAEGRLSGWPRFHSVDGSAEATGLGPNSVDHVAAAQAFHWFSIDATRAEFGRICRPGGRIVLVWNRRTEASPFLRAYEDLLQRLSADYGRIDHRKTTASGVLAEFYGRGGYHRTALASAQVLDWDGLCGRALSSSYVALPGRPGHEATMRELRRIFDAHGRNGRVTIHYETEVFWGRVD